MITYAKRVNPIIAPLIEDQLEDAIQLTASIFPYCKKQNEKEFEVDEEEDLFSGIYDLPFLAD